MTNIRDIAVMANVSVTTVSRVLNNHPYVSEEKREAVMQAVKQSNYHKNINAVHLSKGKTYLIGIVLPYSDHPYFGQLLHGIANQALEYNYKLVLFQTNYQKEKEEEALHMLEQRQIDGLIICSRTHAWNIIEEYAVYGPIALLENCKSTCVSTTYIDHFHTFYQALEYLYQNGHRKIGYSINRKSGVSSQQREAAFKAFANEKELSNHSTYIFDQCLHYEDGEKVYHQIKGMADPPSAVVVTSDQVAACLVTCCQKGGIDVPKDLAVLGFDNHPMAKYMEITTMEIPHEEIGKNLFKQVIQSHTITHKKVEVQLIKRKTV
ncbi:Catabolite control protein B [Paraliobacillus sp. PM-2]|uniref:LacI family DNA-binding transcriptional regulator n=1 Tax=Paraliobacillus sp. PM-2 TaxID=1462524 RepID=UPI00061CD2CE|nr:LacI family DNA-binding transcriptional regulator [Paraliobacillus sp. PM-2]CQR47897.1 Catabolite control protein B [Paraliobacillus sp. PM-2]